MNIAYRTACSFLEFLDSNPGPEYLDLLVREEDNCISLVYVTYPKHFPLYDMRANLVRYRGESMKTCLQLFDDAGCNLYNIENKLRRSFSSDEVEEIHDYVKNKVLRLGRKNKLQLLSSPENGFEPSDKNADLAFISTSEDVYKCSVQIMQLTKQLFNDWNDDISEDLESTLEFLRRQAARQSYYKSQDREELIKEIVDHPFDDGIKLKQVNTFHFRPFTFVGFWVSIPDSVYAPVSIDIAFYDTRRPGCITQMDIQKYFTNEVCLYSGWEHLQLNPSMRSWCEESGQPHPAQKGLRLISAVEIKQQFGE